MKPELTNFSRAFSICFPSEMMNVEYLDALASRLALALSVHCDFCFFTRIGFQVMNVE